MRVLILGATGMLGHKLMQVMSAHFDVTGTVRGSPGQYSGHPLLGDMNLIGEVRADQFESIRTAIEQSGPDVVINCIGIVKQLPEAYDAIPSIAINALFPHQVAQVCHQHGIRLIHYSTDCVFSGMKGNYLESDLSDANDLYGRTKYLGEVTYKNCLTLRTSLIGRELRNGHSLIEWFISQTGTTVKGFKKAIFNGLTTKAHARILMNILTDYPDLEGLWHLSSDPINKYDLLTLVKEQYHLEISIEPEYDFSIDRSLNSDKFRENIAIPVPTWTAMIEEMYQDEQSYDRVRKYDADQ
jgi:dTDP-4-dehydrorhamnose reductase